MAAVNNVNAFNKGDEVYLNKDTKWTKETVCYMSEDSRGALEMTITGIYNKVFKLRKSGYYAHPFMGTIYPMSDPTAKVLYEAYVESLKYKAALEAAKVKAEEARRELNWARQSEVDALNKEKDTPSHRFGMSSTMDGVDVWAGAKPELIGLTNTSEFDPKVVISIRVFDAKYTGGNGGTMMTLTLEAAEEMVQQLADAVIDARTRLIPKVEELKASFVKEDKAE